MFPVANFDPENPIFSNPVLVNKTTGIEVDLSLDAARIWLQNLSPYIDKRFSKPKVSIENETAIFNKMLALCEADE